MQISMTGKMVLGVKCSNALAPQKVDSDIDGRGILDIPKSYEVYRKRVLSSANANCQSDILRKSGDHFSY